MNRVVDGDSQADRQGTHRDDVERLPCGHHPAGGRRQRKHVGHDRDQSQPQRPERHHHHDENLNGCRAKAAGQIGHHLIEIAPAHDRLTGKRKFTALMGGLDPPQPRIDPFKRRLARDGTAVGHAERDSRRLLGWIVEIVFQRRRQQIEQIHPVAGRPLSGEGVNEPADRKRVAQQRLGAQEPVDIAKNIGDLLRRFLPGPLQIGGAYIEPAERRIDLREGTLGWAARRQDIRLAVIRLHLQCHDGQHREQTNRQSAGDPGMAEREVDPGRHAMELAADQFAAGAARKHAAPGGGAAQRQHRQHRHPGRRHADHARPAKIPHHLMPGQRQRRHPDRRRDHRQKAGNSNGGKRPPAGLARGEACGEPAADIDHHVHRVGKPDEAQKHRQDHMAEGVVLEADRAHKPERPKNAQRRRRRRDKHDREPTKEEGREGQNQTIADELVDAFIGVAVAHPLQPNRHRAGERAGELHIGMLCRRHPGGGQEDLGDVGLLLHQRPVVGDEEEKRFGIGREQLPNDQRMLESLLAGHLKALGRRGAAGQDRFVEAEDIERRGAVEPSDSRHRVEGFEPLHDMPQCRSPPTRERCRAFHHHDRIGPPESRPPAAASPPPPWRLDAGGCGGSSRSSGQILVAGSLGICLPPGSVPRSLGPAWIAVARGRQ